MLNYIRKLSFWTLDILKGGKVYGHYKDINYVLNNYGSKQVLELKNKRLNELLIHATSTTPFYYYYKDFNSINDFPLINKNIIRESYNNFMSNNYKSKNNVPVVTSGSTGTPFKLFHNKDKRFRNTADIIYFAKLAGFKIGTKLFYMKVWNNINMKSPLKMWMENIVPHSIYSYSDDDFKSLLMKMKKDPSNKGLVGFASTFELLCNYLDKVNSPQLHSYKVSSIIANSEALDLKTKKRMEFYFGAPAVSRYSNMENGMLAQQICDGTTDFHINWASFFIEILDMNEDKPAKLGMPGRVVITDLFNYCMPMIRYENGDIATMDLNKEGELVLKQIEGRKVDILYNTKGELVTSHIVTVNMWKYSNLIQYQFIQEGAKDYLFKLNSKTEKFDEEKDLINEFMGYLGKDANIKIEYVSDIPLLASGKRKLVVSKYLKK